MPIEVEPAFRFQREGDAHEIITEHVKIIRLIDAVGEAELVLPSEHTLAVAPALPTIVPSQYDGTRVDDVKWGPLTFGYLPAGMRLNATFLEPSSPIYVRLSDQFVRSVVPDTVDPDRVNFRELYDVNAPVATHLIMALGEIATHKNEHEWPLLVESIATALAARLIYKLTETALNRSSPYPDGLPRERLKLVIDYIEANIHRTIRLVELANIVHLSPFHFARAFGRAMSIPPVRYVWRRRVECAKRMLRVPQMTLAAIAYDCGFSSQSHFATVFKKETGLTPTAFRAAL